MSALLQNLATLKQNWRHTQLLDSTRNLASAHVLDTAVLSCVRDLQLVALADFVSRTHNICVFVCVCESYDRTVKGEEKRGGLVLVRFCVFVGLYSNHRDNENRHVSQ